MSPYSEQCATLIWQAPCWSSLLKLCVTSQGMTQGGSCEELEEGLELPAALALGRQLWCVCICVCVVWLEWLSARRTLTLNKCFGAARHSPDAFFRPPKRGSSSVSLNVQTLQTLFIQDEHQQWFWFTLLSLCLIICVGFSSPSLHWSCNPFI